MMSAGVRVQTNTDAASAVSEGTRDALEDTADAGYATSQQYVPHGADSHLANSGYEPTELADGTWIWGYRAEYARYVEEGTRPHWVPIKPLLKWARRVLGDEGAAYAVRQKIAEEGTPAQPFVQPAVDTMRAYLKTHGISGYISERLS